VLAIENHFIALVQYLASFHNPTQCLPLWVFLLFFDRDASSQRVSDEDRLGETQFVIPVSESYWIDLTRRKANANGERHSAVRDALAKGCGSRKFRIDVMREVVSRVPRVDDNISFRNRAS